MDYEQRANSWHLEEVVRDRDLVREESKTLPRHVRNIIISARRPVTEVQTLSPPMEAARDKSDYLHKQLQHQRQQSSDDQLNLSETQRLANARDSDQRERHMIPKK